MSNKGLYARAFLLGCLFGMISLASGCGAIPHNLYLEADGATSIVIGMNSIPITRAESTGSFSLVWDGEGVVPEGFLIDSAGCLRISVFGVEKVAVGSGCSVSE